MAEIKKRPAAKESGLAERLIASLRVYPIRDREILSAMRRVPRRFFLDEAMRVRAGDDDALPIGHAQTTSQPLVVARMLEMMRHGKKNSRVLEVGAGCGYVSALLAELCDEVFAAERIAALAAKARKNLRELGYNAVRIAHADGMRGIAEAAPFDGILVSAATEFIPPILVSQLADNARLILPLTDAVGKTRLTAVVRNKSGEAQIAEESEAVSFVPLLAGLEKDGANL